MPTHSGKGKANGKSNMKSNMKPMSSKQHSNFKDAVKQGLITQKQHDKLPPHLLEAIIKSKKGKKGKGKK